MSGEQNLVHFVHRDSLFEDYIFSIGCYLTLQPDGTHVDLFPGFKNFALDDEGKSDSNIAGVFKRKWKQLFDIIESYLVFTNHHIGFNNVKQLFPFTLKGTSNIRIRLSLIVQCKILKTRKQLFDIIKSYMMVGEDEKNKIERQIDLFCLAEVAASLAAHGAKKLGIQTMGDIMSMTIQDISMRGGWALKSFNTFFDYWVGSYASSIRSGKALAGWISPTANGYHGGTPPTMKDISTDDDKIDKFVSELMGHHIHVLRL